jgi:hypothetical protein
MSGNGMDRPCSRPASEHACVGQQKEHHAMPKSSTAVVIIGIDPGKNTLRLVASTHEEGSCCARKVARAVLNHGRGTARTVVISIAPKAANVRIAPARIAKFYDFQAEYRLPPNIKWPLKPVRCQRTRVSGWMIARTCRIDGRTTRSFGQLRDSITSSTRIRLSVHTTSSTRRFH